MPHIANTTSSEQVTYSTPKDADKRSSSKASLQSSSVKVASSLSVIVGLKIFRVWGSLRGVWKVTFKKGARKKKKEEHEHHNIFKLQIAHVATIKGEIINQKFTFIAFATLFGGKFSFWDRRRMEGLPVGSGGAKKNPQSSAVRSSLTFPPFSPFSAFKICRLILEYQHIHHGSMNERVWSARCTFR